MAGDRVGVSGRVAVSGRFATPADIAGLVGWWRADLGVTTATGVSQWNDQSTSGFNVAQATGSAQPALIASAYNGKPCVRFVSASSQVLTRASTDILAAGAYSIFAACKMTANNQAAFSNCGSASNGIGMPFTDGANRSVLHPGVAAFDDAAFNASALEIWSAVRGASAKPTLRILSAPASLSGAATTMVDPGASANLAIGARTDQASGVPFGFLDGDIAEIAVYNVALTDAQVFAIENYMRARYGV